LELSTAVRARAYNAAACRGVPGDFTFTEAIAAAGHGIGDSEVVNAVGGLVSKSLAVADVSGPVARFRLPETTRAYASTKLRMSQPVVRCDAVPAMM
jgi:predicted ATPase